MPAFFFFEGESVNRGDATSSPAILGGRPVRPEGPAVWPPLDGDILEALQKAHAEGSWARYQGEHGERLAAFLRDVHQVEHVLLCGSGTFAVELALRALKSGPDDEVLLADYDFPGNFLGIHAVGAQPVLVDVSAGNWNLAVDRLGDARSPKTRLLIASHLHGGVVPMAELMAWARQHRIQVIEDAAQCPGAMVDGRKAGTWGDVGTLSFGGSKLLTAGRGGALLTPHADVFQRARTSMLRGNVVCPLSELQAAVLLPQCRKLAEFNRRRLDAVRSLTESLADFASLTPFVNPPGNHEPGYYKVGFRFDEERFGLDRARFVAAMRAEGVALDEGFAALHVGRSPRRFRAGGPLDEASRAHTGAVILHHPVLLEGPAALAEIVAALHKIREHATAVREAVLPKTTL